MPVSVISSARRTRVMTMGIAKRRRLGRCVLVMVMDGGGNIGAGGCCRCAGMVMIGKGCVGTAHIACIDGRCTDTTGTLGGVSSSSSSCSVMLDIGIGNFWVGSL